MKSVLALGAALFAIQPLTAQDIEALPVQNDALTAPPQQQPVTQPTQTPVPAAPAQTAPQQQPAQSAFPTAQPAPQPATPAKASDHTTVVDIVAQSPQHRRLVSLVQMAGLATALEDTGPFTIFAPTDAAFELLGGDLVELMKDENRPRLDRLLKYHVVRGYLTGTELVRQLRQNGGRGSLPTLAGPTLIASLSPLGQVVLTDPEGNAATLTATDMQAFNGLVHTTNAVLRPGEPDDGKKKKRKRR